MTSDPVQRAEVFIWHNARLLDRHLFAHLFKDGPKDAVLGSLRAYQNSDGGFGNALEPDIRAPLSQPQPVEIAFHVLDMVDGFDDPMVARACDYLTTITTDEGGVPFSLPSLNPYPHAPWWTAPDNPPANTNPTAAIAGLLLKHGVTHPWLERVSAFCWQTIEASESSAYHDLMPMLLFLEHAPDRVRADRELARLGERIRAPGVVARLGGEGYVQGPLDWAPTPRSFCRSLFGDDVIDANLRALLAAQQEDGGWSISWPPVSPGCELEWRGWKTVGALHTLRAYGALA